MVVNAGQADRSTGVSSDVAERVELHTTVIEDGVLVMHPLSNGAVVPADGELRLEPGGRHVMLMGLAEPLRVDDSFLLTLDFERARPIGIEVFVVHPSGLGEAMDMESHD